MLMAITAWSCSEDDLDSKSIFDNSVEEQNHEFDVWLYNNYTKPYNIDFKFRMEDKESDMTYNLVPAQYKKSVALAKMVKFLWIEAYEELAGNDFISTYCPKMIHLIGSPAYNTQGSIVLGTAEGGLKITLYNVNNINIEDIDIEQLNYYYFKTMHHEFAHILHQTKNYSTDYQTITATNYQSSNWVNVEDLDALWMGFITPYGSSEPNEDFVEMIANYVTHTADWWDEQMFQSVKCGYTCTYYAQEGEEIVLKKESFDDIYYTAAQMEYIRQMQGWETLEQVSVDNFGYDALTQKLDIVKDYMKVTWGIDIDQLRDIVQRRSEEVIKMDLETLN